jgi:hypothetical protein
VASVHGTLAAFPERWLLIFDNVPDRASVEAFLPPAGRGRVLITSQSAVWPPGWAVEVPVLGTAVAAGFLVNRTGDRDESAAAELAEGLGGLPLALEQAAAYIQASDDSPAGYLALFLRRRPEMLARGEPTGYDSTVAATWSLAFTQLEHSAPTAVGLLRLLACCAPEAIPVHLLLQQRPWLAGRLGDLVEPLLAPGARGRAGGEGCGSGAAPLFAAHPGRGRTGVGAPAGAGRHARPDDCGPGRSVARSRG